MLKISDEKLQTFGLPEMQAKVYLAALEIGEATLQTLSRKSGVNRSTIYTFIEELKNRGYLFETKKGKRKFYSAAGPEHVIAVEQARVRDLEAMLPELLAINNASRIKPRVKYYEGMQGLREVYQDMLREGKNIVAYEDLEHIRKGLSPQLFQWFPPERARRGIGIKTISRDSSDARNFSKKNKALRRETKFVKAQDFKTDINIYGDKLALIDVRGDTPFCVLIENAHLANTMREIWRLLWERLDEPKK